MSKSKKKSNNVREQISKTQYLALKALSKKGEMTRSEISKALGDVFVGGNLMGHVDPSLSTPSSLLGRGMVKVAVYPNKETGADGPAHYSITAAGKKAVETYVEPSTTNKAAKSKGAKKKAPAKKKSAGKTAALRKAPAKRKKAESSPPAPEAAPAPSAAE